MTDLWKNTIQQFNESNNKLHKSFTFDQFDQVDDDYRYNFNTLFEKLDNVRERFDVVYNTYKNDINRNNYSYVINDIRIELESIIKSIMEEL